MMKKIIGFCGLLLWSLSVSAGIKFNPIQLYIQDSTRQRSTTVSVESTGLKKSRIFEISAVKWKQNQQGEDILEEDKTLLFNPKTFELKPESKQIVRVGFSQPLANMNQEQTWRIIFKEVTPIEDDSSINFLFNFSLPLFAGKQVNPKLNLKLEKLDNQAYLNIDNVAKSHIKIIEILVTDNKDKEILKKKLGQYVLGGNRIKLELGEITNNNELKIKIKTDKDEKYLEYSVKG
ncbi:fimbrial biogenesis chaperone [Acinetobacter terrestris]|uniref:Molecular chaperone n=1 Tax=Acinetobacter terrestris TaxID=2529843 RepID=A0ABX1UQ89_9GAMM|nr:fimbria/pilus periplasmic chaperone [Acinetobacter terrestris]NNH25380.1 molecular chaperone [Acinetobacter terrestris]NNH35661.1 molecular chaperone [Acinetobacter terrestris]TCB47148.1 molecular chaperone [Acinetobacter terrestris]